MRILYEILDLVKDRNMRVFRSILQIQAHRQAQVNTYVPAGFESVALAAAVISFIEAVSFPQICSSTV